MAEELVLILLVLVMLVGSYLAGIIPLIMKLSEEKLKIVTLLGAGLLVGTALAVIIPEGIHSLYMENTVAVKATVASAEATSKDPEKRIETEQEHQLDHSRTIGLSLVLGFVFMMLVDQISQRRHSANDKNITATLGLVVHAAADGIALGAAATTSHQDVEIIVFLAIMLHKAPAAFGLVSFLLHEKIERQEIRKHLLFFSLSAPLFTLLTFFGIGQEQKETLNSLNATGIAMLFSAGTFLYVATVHVLSELTHGEHHRHAPAPHSQYEYHVLEQSGGSLETLEKQRPLATQVTPANHKGLRNTELFVMVCGALLPLIITMGHDH